MMQSYRPWDEPVPGFRLARTLAQGELTTIWRAVGPGGTDAALKIIRLVSSQTVREFCSIRLLKHIRHPNIVPTLAFWLKDSQGNLLDETLLDAQFCESEAPGSASADELIIAMGLGDKSLADRLQECQRAGTIGLPPAELLDFLGDAAKGIDYLNQPIHDLGSGKVGIQHCDIKPGNILIVGNAAQVCDLGIARIMGDPRTTDVVGSVAYVAPEVLLKSLPSEATDQYSLAISYCELRTGRLPFQAASAAGACFAHLKGQFDFGGLLEAEQAVIARATAMVPEQRFPNCTAMVDALKEACGSAGSLNPPSEAPAPSPAPRDASPRSRAGKKSKQVQRSTLVRHRRPTMSALADHPLENQDPQHLQDVAMTEVPKGGRSGRRRPRFALATLFLATLIGPLAAWVTRGSAPGQDQRARSDDAATSTLNTDNPKEESPADGQATVSPPPAKNPATSDARPFLVASNARACASLAEAFALARDNDTITIHGNGPFMTEPVAAQGKALTVKAAPGYHPVFRYTVSSADQALQPLIASDQALVLEGLELRREGYGVSSTPQGPAFLLTSERAPLRLRDCSLLVPHGSGVIVCRDPRSVELHHCTVATYALAVFIEAGEQSSCSLDLRDNSIEIGDPEGAAFCVCGPEETGRGGAVRLHLEGNLVWAGRLAGFQRLSQGIDIEAYGNHFAFRAALVSYRELPDHNGWRKATTWRGRDNRYVGTDDWIQVDGAPAGIRSLKAWQALWGGAEPGSTDAVSPGAFRRGRTGGVAGITQPRFLASYPVGSVAPK
jgi:serine/threonine protein kinase